MTKKLYVYKSLDVCDPGSGAYHEEGGLLVVTSGYPNDVVKWGTGNQYTLTSDDGVEVKYGLPEPDHVIEVPDETADMVITFPDSGCC